MLAFDKPIGLETYGIVEPVDILKERGSLMFDIGGVASYPTYDLPGGLQPRLSEFGTVGGTGSTGGTAGTGGAGTVNIPGLDLTLNIGGGTKSGNTGSMLEDSIVSALNAVERALIDNRNSYLSGPGTLTAQSAAIQAFDQAWSWVISSQGLGAAGLGVWGTQGIRDRQRGGKFDWFAAYRDPIAQDPRIKTDPISGTISDVQEALGVSTTILVVIVALTGYLLLRRYG